MRYRGQPGSAGEAAGKGSGSTIEKDQLRPAAIVPVPDSRGACSGCGAASYTYWMFVHHGVQSVLLQGPVVDNFPCVFVCWACSALPIRPLGYTCR